MNRFQPILCEASFLYREPDILLVRTTCTTERNRRTNKDGRQIKFVCQLLFDKINNITQEYGISVVEDCDSTGKGRTI